MHLKHVFNAQAGTVTRSALHLRIGPQSFSKDLCDSLTLRSGAGSSLRHVFLGVRGTEWVIKKLVVYKIQNDQHFHRTIN